MILLKKLIDELILFKVDFELSGLIGNLMLKKGFCADSVNCWMFETTTSALVYESSISYFTKWGDWANATLSRLCCHVRCIGVGIPFYRLWGWGGIQFMGFSFIICWWYNATGWEKLDNANLILFEIIQGKLNFHKSLLVGVNVAGT